MLGYSFSNIGDCVLFAFKSYFFLFSFCAIISLIFLIPKFFFRIVKKRSLLSLIFFICIIVSCIFFITRDMIIILSLLTLLVSSYFMHKTFLQAMNFKKQEKKKEIPDQIDEYPEISIVFPLKNESNVICLSLDKVFEVDYPKEKINVIVIDDHSTDDTYEVLMKYSQKNKITVYKNDKDPGKASALNNFLKYINTEFMVIMDADHFMSKDFFQKSIPYFKNPKVGLVQGMHIIRNGNQSIIAKLVELEYHALHQVIYYIQPMPVYLGSGAVFKTEVFKSVGAFNNDIPTEDWEISYRMHQQNYEVVFSNRFCTYELAPVSLSEFLKQRYRWLRGTWQAVKIQFSNMLKSNHLNSEKKLNFLVICLFPLTLTAFFIINVFYSLAFLKIISWPFDPLWHALIYVPYYLSYFLSIKYAKKPKMAPVLLLIPLFYSLYSIATFEAMFDEWVLNSEFKGVKSDRSTLKIKS
jgi:cellulose synthase/poly-beta-1,6-N-acetylglucosamine synthase-like glycosyltransferase